MAIERRSGTVAAVLLPVLAAAATLTIWNPDPFMDWFYEGGVFLLAGWVALRTKFRFRLLAIWVLLAVWGFVQFGAGWTAYRNATLNGSLRVAAFSATALVASAVFHQSEVRDGMLRGFVWFGLFLGIISVIAYYVSPGNILWLFSSPYPDVWGPFLSRNNFAQFIELVFPVALWLACSGRRAEDRSTYIWMSAVLLACGLVSSSRAGAVLLVLETVGIFLLVRPKPSRRVLAGFAGCAIVLAAVAGGDTLMQRFRDPDPLRYRREIYASSLAMIAERPWTGYGLGTFATVYPEFATFDAGAAVEHAHNDWLEWASEGGWPYAGVWLLLALASVRPALRSIWGIGVVAVFLHALVDYPFARFGVAAWLFILIGAAENSGAETAP